MLAADALLEAHQADWLVREIRLLLKRVLKRVDMTSRSPGRADRAGKLLRRHAGGTGVRRRPRGDVAGARGGDNRGPATLHLSALNFGAYPMGNGLTRLATRFLGEPDSVDARARARSGERWTPKRRKRSGWSPSPTTTIDWDDEVRLMLEERASFSPDALTGLEANLRFAGPETMETRIFGRLTAWQNWVFQRPNAVGEDGCVETLRQRRSGPNSIRSACDDSKDHASLGRSARTMHRRNEQSTMTA